MLSAMGSFHWTISILPGILLLVVTSGVEGYSGSCGRPAGSGPACGANCTNLKTKTTRSVREAYLDGELYVNFLPYSDTNVQVDNICYTLIPLAGSSNVYAFYDTRVFKNGSIEIQSLIISQDTLGVLKIASPDCGTFNDTVFGHAQCGTYINYRCYSCNSCKYRFQNGNDVVFGLSKIYRPIPEYCLQQSLRIIQANMVPPQRYIALPMELPSACVTRQDCVNYPTPCSDQTL